MSRIVFSAALAAAVSIGALAMAPAAYAAAAPSWAVDKAASRIGWRTTFSGVGLNGTFRTWDAQIAFDPANLAGSRVAVSVDMASVTATDADAQEALPSGDWFDAKSHPRGTFVATTFRSLGGNNYQAVGTLTLKGVARPLILPFTLAINGDTAKMDSTVILDRSLFGIGRGQFQGAETVPHGVNMTITVSAKRQ
jgi:polyisoprenoid-binding protein YceI